MLPFVEVQYIVIKSINANLLDIYIKYEIIKLLI